MQIAAIIDMKATRLVTRNSGNESDSKRRATENTRDAQLNSMRSGPIGTGQDRIFRLWRHEPLEIGEPL